MLLACRTNHPTGPMLCSLWKWMPWPDPVCRLVRSNLCCQWRRDHYHRLHKISPLLRMFALIRPPTDTVNWFGKLCCWVDRAPWFWERTKPSGRLRNERRSEIWALVCPFSDGHRWISCFPLLCFCDIKTTVVSNPNQNVFFFLWLALFRDYVLFGKHHN